MADDADRATFCARLGTLAGATGTTLSTWTLLLNHAHPMRQDCARAQLAVRLVTRLGLSLAEAARHLGVSTSGIAKALARAEAK